MYSAWSHRYEAREAALICSLTSNCCCLIVSFDYETIGIVYTGGFLR